MTGCLRNLKAGTMRVLCAVLMAALCAPALADPPDHAPAHGWRNKQKHHHHKGYTGHEWTNDFGIIEGRCNRDAIGTVLGAVVGGAVGSQIGDGSGRTVAMIVGTVLGAAIGREIGRDMDDRDRACIGHSLELARDGQNVRWMNDAARTSYVLTPMAVKSGGQAGCRNFKLQATRDGKLKVSDGRACRKSDGTWSIVS